MKRFQKRTMTLISFGLALSLTGCGAGDDVGLAEATISGHTMNVNVSDARFFPGDSVTPSAVFLMSRSGGVCSDAADVSSVSVRISLGALADIPLGAPITLSSEKGPVTATATASEAGCDVLAGNPGAMSGAVTFTELEDGTAKGSINLRIEGASSACAVSSPTTVDYVWDKFSTSVHPYGCEE